MGEAITDSSRRVDAGIRSVFARPLRALKELSAGSLMGLTTAAGFLPLLPAASTATGIDPLVIQ
jgi:hypothetical protein